MADIGKISRARMEAYADQARRLGNVSGDLSPAQIEETLRGVTLSGGGIPFSALAVGGYPTVYTAAAESITVSPMMNFESTASGALT